ncbi:MAG: MFS transporter, partial [Pseudomonadota bacterium]|nr:MFS transporter [Pseudomonadota bacterium]
ILDWLGGIKTVILGSTLQGLALFLFLPFDGLVSLYTVSFVFGLSQGGIVPSYAIVIRELMPKSIAGARIGFVIMCTIIGMAFGGWVSGWIFEQTGSYQLAFLHGILWNFLNISIMVSIFFRYQRSTTQSV